MSRSNPTDNAPNPATRWFEWNGEAGTVRYYDKEHKTYVDVPLPFSFMVLDELASVRGWHEASQSGIYSNEVRDTRDSVMVVKAFKGGTIAEGLYRDIKDRVNVAGGSFNANCYLAFKNGVGLEMGAIRFKGAALGAWMEFRKAHRAEIDTMAVEIHGYIEGKKGRVLFRVPQFRVKKISLDSDAVAVELDKTLQKYLTAYLKRTKRDQVNAVTAPVDHEPPPYAEPVETPDVEDVF